MAIDRQQALDLLKQHTSEENLLKHALASEAIMRALAERLGEDPERWGMAGLLHDVDYDQTKDRPEKHTLVAEPILRDAGVDDEMIQAVKAHNAEALGIARDTKMALALTCAETMTGMVIAATLVYPDKKIRSVNPKSVIKRMKEKQFARSVNRDHIRLCERIGIPLNEFAQLSVQAMNGISDDLGL
ncbi:MAG: HDIG domain-containing protein [Deltaproteobacteria bacterium]|nr:HDIG domain-containing protein [Deltaproteobacteria bacterium]